MEADLCTVGVNGVSYGQYYFLLGLVIVLALWIFYLLKRVAKFKDFEKAVKEYVYADIDKGETNDK